MYLSRLLPIRRHALLSGVAILAVSAIAPPALAAEDADEGMLSEVIVTAEKRETNPRRRPWRPRCSVRSNSPTGASRALRT